MVCQTTRTSQQFLQINFFGKADRILGEFECAPLVRELQKHLGDAFTRIRKATRKAETAATVAPSTAPNSMPLVASASVTTVASTAAAAVPIITPTNIQVNQQGQAYSVEEEELVKSIIANGSKSYYDILNVSEQATIADLKLSYRKVAIKVHPDKNRSPNANLAFQLVGQAYSVLSDPDQRAEYDTARQDRKPAPPTAAPPTPFEFDAEELYRSFFPEDDVDTVHVEMSEPDWEFQKDSLEEMFDTILAKQLDNLPDYDMPPQLAHMKLFDYQILGIRFMLHSELRNGIPSWFTQEGPWTWRDKITGTTFQRRPNPVRGCILADDMGLGKSVQTLGLILSNPPKRQTGYPYVPARSLGANTGPRCTLILCPLSVIANWTTQIRKHVNQMGRKSFLKVGIYHGPNRKDMVRSIQANYYDIVLTSYQTLAYDYRRKYGTDEKDKEGNKKTKKDKKEIFLFDLWLHRVVLDEAHIIRNSKTSLFKAVKHLVSAERTACACELFVASVSPFVYSRTLPLGCASRGLSLSIAPTIFIRFFLFWELCRWRRRASSSDT